MIKKFLLVFINLLAVLSSNNISGILTQVQIGTDITTQSSPLVSPGTKRTSIKFEKSYDSKPQVLIYIVSISAQKTNFQDFKVSASDITTNGFNINYMSNVAGNTLAFQIDWISFESTDEVFLLYYDYTTKNLKDSSISGSVRQDSFTLIFPQSFETNPNVSLFILGATSQYATSDSIGMSFSSLTTSDAIIQITASNNCLYSLISYVAIITQEKLCIPSLGSHSSFSGATINTSDPWQDTSASNRVITNTQSTLLSLSQPNVSGSFTSIFSGIKQYDVRANNLFNLKISSSTFISSTFSQKVETCFVCYIKGDTSKVVSSSWSSLACFCTQKSISDLDGFQMLWWQILIIIIIGLTLIGAILYSIIKWKKDRDIKNDIIFSPAKQRVDMKIMDQSPFHSSSDNKKIPQKVTPQDSSRKQNYTTQLSSNKKTQNSSKIDQIKNNQLQVQNVGGSNLTQNNNGGDQENNLQEQSKQHEINSSSVQDDSKVGIIRSSPKNNQSSIEEDKLMFKLKQLEQQRQDEEEEEECDQVDFNINKRIEINEDINQKSNSNSDKINSLPKEYSFGNNNSMSFGNKQKLSYAVDAPFLHSNINQISDQDNNNLQSYSQRNSFHEDSIKEKENVEENSIDFEYNQNVKMYNNVNHTNYIHQNSNRFVLKESSQFSPPNGNGNNSNLFNHGSDIKKDATFNYPTDPTNGYVASQNSKNDMNNSKNSSQYQGSVSQRGVNNLVNYNKNYFPEDRTSLAKVGQMSLQKEDPYFNVKFNNSE